MGGLCKVIPGSLCDQLRTHLPPQSANKDPFSGMEGGQMCSSRYLGRPISCLPGDKKFSDA